MSDKLNDDIVIEGSAVQDNSYNIEESIQRIYDAIQSSL